MSSQSPEQDTGGAGSAPAGSTPSHVVGIGASAGGLEALERLFRAMPADTGMAFVVVQHLSPDFKTLMPELLERHTRMPVVAVERDVLLAANTVYVLTSGLTVAVADGWLRVSPRRASAEHHQPINLLFDSLSHLGARALAVVLSGTGTDGMSGAQAVHAAGGLVIAQLPSSARFDSMPRAAIESGCVDITADPGDMHRAMAGWLADPVQGRHFHGGTAGTDAPPPGGPYGGIVALLQSTFDLDLEHYKPGTIVRRIERRLGAGPAPITPEAYAERLATSRIELDQLFSDLLIGVTRFFRDEPAYEAVQQRALEPMIDALGIKDELRIWVCGCSTGQEPYSLAMLAMEAFERRGQTPRLRILATDLHGASVQFASAGAYTSELVESVPAPLLAKYFVQQPTGLYKVGDDLRRAVIFSTHNVLRDAPFTRVDLVSCRNLLIYLQTPAQTRALAAFHFALRPGGMLLLGESEGTGELHEAFDDVDRDAKLYRKSPGVQLPMDLRSGLAAMAPLRQSRLALDTQTTSRLHELLLQRLVPSGVLVNQAHEVMHVFGDAGRYLKAVPGRFRGELATLLSGPLRTAVFIALRRAAQTRETVQFAAVVGDGSDGADPVSITVDPVFDRSLPQGHFMVRFACVPAVDSTVATMAGTGPQLAVEVEELESELLRVREALQHTVEELEAANEELQAGNEELMAANEELQSTNEELHAVNEELYSVNSEHELKIQELRSTTADLNNLIRATELAILFLDGEARLRMFTPAATEIFPVRAGDIGRDLRDFMPKEADVRLFEDIARALVQPASIDRELVLGDGRCLRRRLAPYRDGRQEAAGLVLTYVDITQQVRLREQLARADAQAEVRAIVESVPHLMWAADAAGACDYVNPQFLAYSGLALPEACGQGWLGLVHEEERRDLHAAWRGAVASGQPLRGRCRLRRADGEYRWFDLQAEARTLNEGSERRWYGCITDVHDATVLQEAIVHHESLMQLVADSVPGMVSYWSREGCNEFANTRYAAIVGLAPERMNGLRRDELPGRGVLPAGDGHLAAVLRGEPQRFASELRAADGRQRKVEVELLPHGSDGQVIGYVETLSDVTELTEAQASIEDLVSWSPVPQLVVSSEGRLLRWNDAALSLLCHDAASLAQIDVEQLLPPDLRRRHRLLRTGYFAQPRRRPMSELPSLPLLRGDGSTVEVQIELGPLALEGQSAVLLNLREAPAPRAADAVEAAMEARMSFLASMSHEIRTPLNAILGMSQLLALDAPTDRQRDRLRRIEDASTHLMGIVDDILDLSKIESGRLVVDAEPFDLRQLVEQSTALVADKARIKQLELRCHVKPDIPGPLVGDARRIEQVLLNLLGNAVKFTHHGHVALGVGWSPAPDGRVLLRFEVEDTGIGIAAEVLPMLFRPFRQADHGHTRRYGGTGLGLAISRQLARAMNGDCGVRSVLGQGSSFWFTVQVGRAPGGADVAPAPPRASTVALHRRWRGRRVLLVEDDLVSQIVAQELIRAVCGLEADVAVDGQDAVDKASATPYDLILMDMQLPVLSGLDATRRILALPGYAKVPIVALTANVMPEDVTQCMEAGMQGHLGKPIVADELRGLFAAPLRPGRRVTLRRRAAPA